MIHANYIFSFIMSSNKEPLLVPLFLLIFEPDNYVAKKKIYMDIIIEDHMFNLVKE